MHWFSIGVAVIAAVAIIVVGCSYVGEKPFIHLENVWWVDEDIPGFKGEEGWRIQVKGDTDLNLRFTIGERDKIGYQIIGPALRAIPWVCAAPAGIVRQPAFAPWNPGYRKPSQVVVAG